MAAAAGTDIGRSCSWWLLAQPEAGKIGKLSWNLASGFLALLFFFCPSLKATAKGEWKGWVFVSFKPQGFHPLRASASKAPAVPVSRILLILCLRFIHIYIEIYLINILYENKYFICVLRTIVMLIYSPAIMLCLVFVLDNAVPIALFLTYRHHLPASSWGSRKPPRGRDGPFASSSFNVLTAWVWLVLVKFMRKMLPFTAPVSL